MAARQVEAEQLDHLSEADPAAQQSRHDLLRIHRAMGTRGIVQRGLTVLLASHRGGQPLRLLELGAGDGRLLLGVARALHHTLPAVELTLLDRQQLVEQVTLDAYASLGWRAAVQVEDVRVWAGLSVAASAPAATTRATERWDLIMANLFLHHFDDSTLAPLLAAIAARSDRFFACEPGRGWLALAGSHLVGLLGANAVTRADAVLSVRAGFCQQELSTHWPGPAAQWQINEYRAGLFSHCLQVERRPVPP